MPDSMHTQEQIIHGSIWDAPTAAALNPIGARVQIGERVFRYCKVTTAMTDWSNGTAGHLLVCNDTAADEVNVAATYFGADLSTAPVAGEGGAAGDMKVRVYGVTLTVHICQGGYLCITDGAGEGYLYGIKDNDVITTGTSGIITLHDPIQVLLTAGSVGIIHQSLFMDLAIPVAADFGGDVDMYMVGSAVKPFTTTNTYGWVQTWGPCLVKAGSVGIQAGQMVVQSEDNNGAGSADDDGRGAVIIAGEEFVQPVGFAIDDASDGEWALTNLTLMP